MTPGIVAHRGASGERPEHTSAAYELALEQGADGLECDVRLTRDGQLVCVHDRSIARTSDGRGLVSAMTLQQLREWDFGMGGPAAGVLTLSELIGLALECGRAVTLFVETKHPVRYGGLVEHKLLAELQRHGLAGTGSSVRVLVMSFAASAVRRINRAAPAMPAVLLGESSRLLSGALVGLAGATAIGPSIQTLRANPDLVDRAAASGRETYCWTVDKAEDIRFCADLGVHWIATNYPGRTREILAEAVG